MEFKIPEDHPFSLLIPLVEEGKLDPWSVDIANLAQIYMEQIKTMELLDMRIPANALSAATFLFKKKMEVIFPRPKIQRQRMSLKEIIEMYDEAQPKEQTEDPPKEEKPKVKKTYIQKSVRKTFTKKRKIPLHRSILKDVIEEFKNKLNQKKGFYFSEVMDKEKASVQFTALMFIQYDKNANLYQQEHYGDIYIEKS